MLPSHIVTTRFAAFPFVMTFSPEDGERMKSYLLAFFAWANDQIGEHREAWDLYSGVDGIWLFFRNHRDTVRFREHWGEMLAHDLGRPAAIARFPTHGDPSIVLEDD